MSDIPIDRGPAPAQAEIEREKTRQALIQAVVTVVLVVLYMAYSLLRGRDGGVVPIGGSASADDWQR